MARKSPASFTSKVFVVLLGLFFLSRWFILQNPPPHYSDVSHDYERYANMWQYGLPPYLKHFYEYPPATVPLLWLPLKADLAGIGKYYSNYRVGIFFLDLLFFFLVYRVVRSSGRSGLSQALAFGFFLIAPMVAKDFFYEGIDWAFITSLTAGLLLFWLLDQGKLIQRIAFWGLVWLSTAIKFMSLPLVVPLFYLKKLSLKKELIACLIGFLLIWGVPLAIFRSSLSVSFVFHAQRGLKYASFPGFLVEVVNQVTHTEMRLNEPPDFPLVGPVATQVKQVFGIVFLGSVALVLLYAVVKILKPRSVADFLRKGLFFRPVSVDYLDRFAFSLKLALIFIFTLFLTGKIFSQPFHLWYLPLITIFPFSKIKTQLTFMALALWLLIVDTTPWIRFEAETFPGGDLGLTVITGLWRFVPMMVLLYLSFRLPDKARQKA